MSYTPISLRGGSEKGGASCHSSASLTPSQQLRFVDQRPRNALHSARHIAPAAASRTCVLGVAVACALTRPKHTLCTPALFSTPAAISLSRRTFYSGLDESRVHRLRRSGMTFNRPRGRDTFSVAFESRLRIVPLTQMSDLYGPIDASLLTAVNVDDPTSSAGNPLEQKKYMAGDAQMRRVVEQKRKDEANLRNKQDWHVLVVDPIELAAAAAPVPFPNPHPSYYNDWAASGAGAQRAGRRVLEQRDADAFGDPTLPFLNAEKSEETEAGVADVGAAPTDYTAGVASAMKSPALFYRSDDQSHLQQSGDTTLLRGTAVRTTTLHLPHPESAAATAAAHAPPTTPHTIRQHFHTAVCVDPDIHHDRFHREEAQVELISAYRNILYEAVELAQAAAADTTRSGGSLRRTSATMCAVPYVADVVRVPALGHYSCGRRFFHELGKLNQQSVIKGFHRLSNEAKEALISNRCFTVEVFVPPLLLDQFERAFLEEAWEPPTSTLNPGRTALYPGLAPPRSLLEYDGWIGKRPELVEAIKTKGKSLLSGVKYGLDGKLIEEREVLANLRVFGAREEQQKMLEGERATAAEQLGTPTATVTHAPLRAGLQEEAVGDRESRSG